MREIHDIHGGIHPPERKIAVAPRRTARRDRSPLAWCYCHCGSIWERLPRPSSSVGETLYWVGKCSRRAQGAVSVPVHAPTSGHRLAPLNRGRSRMPRGSRTPASSWRPMAQMSRSCCEGHPRVADSRRPRYLVERIREAGIAGMGGAGFPTAAVKLNSRR